MEKKTVLVTGGARGIGKEIALKFAENNFDVIVNYRSDEPTELKNEIENFGVECLLIKADVSKFDEAELVIKEIKEKFKRLDVIVNNAGITKDGLILRMKESDFDDVIDVNLKGAFNIIRHSSQLLLKQKSGSIINITSVIGLTGNAGQSNYAASKAGLIGLTKSIAKELGSKNISCNAVAPGFIKTDMTDSLPEETKNKILENVPLKRFGIAKEVADLVYFLANATYITGQVMKIDGGLVM